MGAIQSEIEANLFGKADAEEPEEGIRPVSKKITTGTDMDEWLKVLDKKGRFTSYDDKNRLHELKFKLIIE